ncbi:hypothetical protein [Burkholderia phage FLC9]|nr:hypothetical protein [Burkholderia phage FLC9]
MATMTPSGEQLIILLNETFIPPTIFSDKNLVFGTPSAAPEDATDYDTVVTATGVPGRGYWGSAEIHYTKVPLSNLDGVVSLASLDNFTLDSIAQLMNAAYGTFLDASDFVPQDITTPPLLGSSTVTLVAADTSLGWKGQVDITITHDKPHLDVAISNQRLNVLTDAAKNRYLNGRDYLWNYDFTSLRDAIKPKYYAINQFIGYSGFTDYTTLSNVCLKLGIPWFPNPNWVNTGVSDYATSQIADSNKNFDRVVIFSPVLGGPFYQSAMYFHYNVLENR